MSARVSRSDRSLANEFEWLEFSDRVEISPASIWAAEDEDEITLQSKRVAVPDFEQVTAVRVDESSAREVTGRVRVLDESSVLPGEASFANVVLNHPIEPTTVKSREHLTASNVERATVSKAGPRARILDESVALPGEASFATAMLNQRTNAHTYSPLAEFLVKSNLNWRRLNLAMLLLVLISTAIMLIILTITQKGAFSSHKAANTPAEDLPRPTEPAPAQIELKTPEASESDAVSNAQKEVNAPVASTPMPKLEGEIEAQTKFSKATNSEPSQRVAVDDAKSNVARKVLRQDSKSVASKDVFAGESSKRKPAGPRRHASAKDISKSATAPARVRVDHPPSEILGSHEASSSSRNEAGQTKAESQSVPATGGGQRPRRVTLRAP
jgi:hypothetical protein